jgi:hypothetical protein
VLVGKRANPVTPVIHPSAEISQAKALMKFYRFRQEYPDAPIILQFTSREHFVRELRRNEQVKPSIAGKEGSLV